MYLVLSWVNISYIFIIDTKVQYLQYLKFYLRYIVFSFQVTGSCASLISGKLFNPQIENFLRLIHLYISILLEVNKNVSAKKFSCKAPQVHLKHDFFFVVACMLYVA